jgi:hypothetical protein
MKRDTRPLRCDNDPHGVTRRDIIPAPIRFGEESSPASSSGPIRELQPYSALRPNADDATVKYALVQDASAPHYAEGERPSDVPPELRSGTRVTPTSTLPPKAALRAPSTTPPASHVKAKAPQPNARISTPLPSKARIGAPLPSNARIGTPLPSNARISTPLPSNARIITPLPRSDGHYTTPSVSFAPAPKPISIAPSASAPPASRHRPPPLRGPSLLGTVSIALITIVFAAILGASLGNGSMPRLWTRFFAEAPQPALAPAANPLRTPAVSAPRAPSLHPQVAAPAPSSASAPAAPSTPAVRFEDLPAEPTSEVETAPLGAPRVHPRTHRR